MFEEPVFVLLKGCVFLMSAGKVVMMIHLTWAGKGSRISIKLNVVVFQNIQSCLGSGVSSKCSFWSSMKIFLKNDGFLQLGFLLLDSTMGISSAKGVHLNALDLRKARM